VELRKKIRTQNVEEIFMQCPNCGATVLKDDEVCKKCNTHLRNAREAAQEEKTKRSRLAVLLLCWSIGWLNGQHLKYLGFHDKAQQYSRYSMFNPIFYAWFFTGHLIECLAIIGGKYKVDAHGNPVNWP
jgi:predicted amidophosphoribosyltransferase